MEGICGNGGGLCLVCVVSLIVVGDVVCCVECILELVECFVEGCNCIFDLNCKLKSMLVNVLYVFMRVLD